MINRVVKSLLLTLFVSACVLLPCQSVKAQEAEKIECNFYISSGANAGNMLDGSYNSCVSFQAGDSVTISSSQPIGGIYIAWNRNPAPWELTSGENTIPCGENGYLHEFVSIEGNVQEVVMHFNETCSICYINVFGVGDIPKDVQIWNPPCEKADILIFSAHADDEVLFFGGILPTYGVERGASVQVAYLTEFFTTTPIREHEKLDGLWCAGIRNYPDCGNFYDVYCSDLENAKTQYPYDEIISYMTKTIRKYKPQVVTTHDFNGEYGHGFHMLCAAGLEEAFPKAADETFDTESANAYGTWDVPKVYFHLYPENSIHLDLRHPIAEMDGKTAIEIASEAYTKHVSQQWCWFYVSDEYEYSCADFGLYKTNVGVDENPDLLDHLTTYQEQEEEAARIAAEEEAKKKAEEEEKARLQEQERIEQAAKEDAIEKESQKKEETIVYILMGVLALVILGAVTTVVLVAVRGKRRRR